MDSMSSGVFLFYSRRVWAYGQALETKKQLWGRGAKEGVSGRSCGELTLGIQTLGDS